MKYTANKNQPQQFHHLILQPELKSPTRNAITSVYESVSSLTE
jgi:hypothetical protein